MLQACSELHARYEMNTIHTNIWRIASFYVVKLDSYYVVPEFGCLLG